MNMFPERKWTAEDALRLFVEEVESEMARVRAILAGKKPDDGEGGE